jgi:hypothetical protein
MNVRRTKTGILMVVPVAVRVDLLPDAKSAVRNAARNDVKNAARKRPVLSALTPGSCAARRRPSMVDPGRRRESVSVSVIVRWNERSAKEGLRVLLGGPRTRGRFALNADIGVKSRPSRSQR